MSRHVPAEILPEGFRNKIFDTEIIAALERALNDEKDDIRSSTVHIFTAAISQGALCFFHGIFIPKYLQRVVGTREFKLRLLPHLDVH